MTKITLRLLAGLGAAAIISSTAAQATETDFTTVGAFSYTALSDGTVTISAFGAAGGNYFYQGNLYGYGGAGAGIQSSFAVTAGEVLTGYVGQSGGINNYWTGGGGGSFIQNFNQALYLVAGGGGGGGFSSGLAAVVSSQNGAAGQGGSYQAGAGGTGGNDGGDAPYSAAGGSNTAGNALGGGTNYAYSYAGGGGGGYSGGGGGSYTKGGGGGGSYTSALTYTDMTGAAAGANAGNGAVLIDFTAAAVAAVPEPATWALMLVGFGAIGGAARRRPSRAVSCA